MIVCDVTVIVYCNGLSVNSQEMLSRTHDGGGGQPIVRHRYGPTSLWIIAVSDYRCVTLTESIKVLNPIRSVLSY